jgi:hypothetical protein
MERAVGVVSHVGSGRAAPHLRNCTRPRRHQPAVALDTDVARSRGAGGTGGLRRAHRLERERPSIGRRPDVRVRLSRCGDHGAGRIGWVRGAGAYGDLVGRSSVLDPGADRRDLRGKLSDPAVRGLLGAEVSGHPSRRAWRLASTRGRWTGARVAPRRLGRRRWLRARAGLRPHVGRGRRGMAALDTYHY